jgi:hypothetical protein
MQIPEEIYFDEPLVDKQWQGAILAIILSFQVCCNHYCQLHEKFLIKTASSCFGNALDESCAWPCSILLAA